MSRTYSSRWKVCANDVRRLQVMLRNIKQEGYHCIKSFLIGCVWWSYQSAKVKLTCGSSFVLNLFWTLLVFILRKPRLLFIILLDIYIIIVLSWFQLLYTLAKTTWTASWFYAAEVVHCVLLHCADHQTPVASNHVTLSSFPNGNFASFLPFRLKTNTVIWLNARSIVLQASTNQIRFVSRAPNLYTCF